MRRGWVGLAALLLAAGGCGSGSGSDDSGADIPPLLAKSIELHDLAGQGWVISGEARDIPLPGCAVQARQRLAAAQRHDVGYERDVNGPYLTETVSRFEPGTASAALAAGIDAYLACDGTEFAAGTTPLVASVTELSYPPQGEESRSVAVTVEGSGVNYLSNVTVVRTGDLLATVTYSDLFLLDPLTSLEFVQTAVRKLTR